MQRVTLGCNCLLPTNSSLSSLCYHLPPTQKLSLLHKLSSVARICCWPLHTVTTVFFPPVHRYPTVCHPHKQCAVKQTFLGVAVSLSVTSQLPMTVFCPTVHRCPTVCHPHKQCAVKPSSVLQFPYRSLKC